MNRYTFIVLALTVFSCNNNVKNHKQVLSERHLEIVEKERSKWPIDLNGKYDIAGFRVFPETSKDSLWLKKFPEITTGDVKFHFIKKDAIVKLDNRFGMKYFGDSIFNYEIKDKFILLKNDTKEIELPYINDNGMVRLFIKNKGVERISIVETK